MPRPTADTLRRQFAWLIAILVVLGVIRFVGGAHLLSSYEADIARSRTAQQANQSLLQVLTDAETGVRGYQLTGERVFLEPYLRAVGEYPQAMRHATAAADPAVRGLLLVQDAAAQAWLTEYGGPIAARPAGRPSADAALSARGKALFDRIRAVNRQIADVLRQDEHDAADQFRSANGMLQGLVGLLALASVLTGLFVARRTSRLLLAPISDLQAVLHRLATGQRSARARDAGPPEVRDLAAALNASLDATDRAEAELRTARDAVELQKGHFQQVLDTLNMAVVTCDEHGELVYRNQIARLRGPHEDPRHVDDLTGMQEHGETRDPLARALTGETFVQREMTLRQAGEPDRAVMVDARRLHDANGTVIGAVASSYDVTVLRDREAELTAFAAVAAHDLKSPLAAVLGYTERIAEDLDAGNLDPHGTSLRLARIIAGVSRMGELIDDLLAYATARDKPLQAEPVDLHTLVAEVAADRTGRLLATDPGTRPTILIEPLPTVPADPTMMRQLLDNVIGNALKYTRPGEPAQVRISATSTDTEVCLRVDDHGIGIPAEQRGRIFTAFHRAHANRPYAGTGLGLAICERVTTRHGGSIRAMESPQGGTRITITLPLTRPASDADRPLCDSTST